jgi:hypothetical protein
MTRKVISEKRWSYVLLEDAERWVLTLLIGGVVEVDVSVLLTDQEIASIEADPSFVEKIVEDVRANRKVYSSREIVRPVWP